MTTLAKRNGENSLFPELPSLFNDPFLRNWFNWYEGGSQPTKNSSVPAVNIRETDDSYELSVAAPGMKKDDFKVELENNRLVIKGETKQQQEERNDNYLRQEFNYQSFTRTFTLAERQVNGEKIQAKYADGILHVSIPKTPEAKTKPARTIPVS